MVFPPQQKNTRPRRVRFISVSGLGNISHNFKPGRLDCVSLGEVVEVVLSFTISRIKFVVFR